MLDPIRLAVAGLGAQGKQLIDCLSRTDKAELVGVVDVNSDIADLVSKERSVPRFLSIGDLVKGLGDNVDGLIVSVPNSLHLVTVTEALECGLHTLVEKPMGLSILECDQMISCAKKNDRLLMVGHNILFYEPHLKVRDMINTGEISRPVEFRTRLTCGRMFGSWRDRAELTGGGLLVDSGQHRFYTARQLMGPVQAVTAWLDTKDPRKVGDETGFVILEFEKGGVGLIDSTFHGPGDTFCDLVELVSKDGLIWITGCEADYLQTWSHPPISMEGPLLINREGKEWERIETGSDDWADTVQKSIEHFAACIRGTEVPITSAIEGRTNMAVLEAAYKSGEEGRRVEVSEVI